MLEHDVNAWVRLVHAWGLAPALDFALGALEPLSPVVAQLLYIMQPAAGLLGWRGAVGDIAAALEAPGGVEALRARLQAENEPDDFDLNTPT